MLHEIDNVIKAKERVLVTTLTKKMAEELTKYLAKLDIKCKYIHSDVDTLGTCRDIARTAAGDY